jgi:hypothetical protein
MTKSHRGNLYIDDSGWGPEADSIEYGFRVPFDGIHVFIGKTGGSGFEPDTFTDVFESARRAQPAVALVTPEPATPRQAGGSKPGPDVFTNIFKPVQDAQPARPKHVFVGFTQGVDGSGESASDGGSASYNDTVVCSEDGCYSSEGESIYPLHDGMLGGDQEDDQIQDSYNPPVRSAIYMAGVTVTIDPASAAAAAAVATDPAAAAAATAAGTSTSAPVILPALALAGLATTLSTLLAMPVTPANQAEHNAEVDKI